MLVDDVEAPLRHDVPNADGGVPRSAEQYVRQLAVPQEPADVRGVPHQLPELPRPSRDPLPHADGLVVTAGGDDAVADRVEGYVEDPCFVALQKRLRLRLSAAGRLQEVEDADRAILARGGEDAVLGGVPRHADDGAGVCQSVEDGPCRRIHNACGAVCATRHDLAGALSSPFVVPLATVGLTGVELQAQHLLARVGAPNKEEPCAADRTDAAGAGPQGQTVEELVLPCEHVAVAFHGRDAPELHVPVIRGSGQHVGVLGVEDDVEDGLRVSRRRHELNCPRRDVADAHCAVLERKHEPVRVVRDRLDAVHPSRTDLDLRERRPLRHVPEAENPNTVCRRDEVARLGSGPGQRLDALRLLVETVDLALRVRLVERQRSILEGDQQVLFREGIPLGVRHWVLGRLGLPDDLHLLASLLVIHMQRADVVAHQQPRPTPWVPPKHLGPVLCHYEQLGLLACIPELPEPHFAGLQRQSDLVTHGRPVHQLRRRVHLAHEPLLLALQVPDRHFAADGARREEVGVHWRPTDGRDRPLVRGNHLLQGHVLQAEDVEGHGRAVREGIARRGDGVAVPSLDAGRHQAKLPHRGTRQAAAGPRAGPCVKPEMAA
mmetsp:Transcript_107713/g.336923  ORF Transcript_107713/g.336923 Transcript_107713/m.336923 type:complete len:605 (+) Transcript_107713:2050-3864(+)